MFSGDFIAGRLGPDVRKIVLALGTTDSEPVRFEWSMCSVSFLSVINACFTAKPKWTPSLLTDPMLLHTVQLLHCFWR